MAQYGALFLATAQGFPRLAKTMPTLLVTDRVDDGTQYLTAFLVPKWPCGRLLVPPSHPTWPPRRR